MRVNLERSEVEHALVGRKYERSTLVGGDEAAAVVAVVVHEHSVGAGAHELLVGGCKLLLFAPLFCLP